MEEDLTAMKQSALRKRCLEQGMGEAALEVCDDADDTKGAFVRWLVENCMSPESKLREELENMKQSALRQRAAKSGATEEDFDQADDAEDTRAAFVDLVVRLELAADTSELRRELAGMKQSQLRKRALSVGVPDGALALCYDAGDTKAAIADLIVEHSPRPGSVAEAVPPEPSHQRKRPHHVAPVETGSLTTLKPKQSPPAAILAAEASQVTKWAMISYSWDDQREAIRVRKALKQKKIATWMDIDGGMEGDIYDSMANGVNNAGVIIALLSQSYQNSENCCLEMKFARDCKVPIVPVYVQGGGWKASGWLGLLTAGALWLQYNDGNAQEFDSFTTSLSQTVEKNIPDAGGATPGAPPPQHDSKELSEMRQELDSLRLQLEAATPDAHATRVDGVANVPSDVPPIRSNLQTTPGMQNAKATLLAESGAAAIAVSSKAATAEVKVGAFGMGGIGKTVMAAWIARDMDIRRHFEVVLWCTLSQTPNLAKLQSVLMKQASGQPIPDETPPAEAKELLAQALKGKRALLILDDCWEKKDEEMVNAVDVGAGSRLLVTTRIKGLLSEAEQLEVGLPSADDAVKLLMMSIGIHSDVPPPPEALEVIEICGRLPLALDIAGKLLCDTGVTAESDWSGIPSNLKADMSRANAATPNEETLEYKVIGVSLSKIPEEDRLAVQAVFRVRILRDKLLLPPREQSLDGPD